MEVLPYVSILFGNESEALAFAKEQNFGTENLKEIGEKMTTLALLDASKRRVIVLTQGQLPVSLTSVLVPTVVISFSSGSLI